ncbi:MAG: zinc ribbon domain-containing protein [Eubacteriaceae bacterium]|nr:zinc ribbon domain-containing protein [Eubacteriaceae bacterium]
MADIIEKTFTLPDGVSFSDVGFDLEKWFQFTKNMQTQSSPMYDGYVIQAREAEDWKKWVGLGKAIQVVLRSSEDKIYVQVGQAEWIDKLGAGILSAFVFLPAVVVPAIGAYRQYKLPDEVIDHIQGFLGGMPEADAFNQSAFAAQAAKAAQEPKAPTVPKTCPNCGAMCSPDAKFCDKCGTKLVLTCPVCGKELPVGTKFCPECGTKIEETEIQ